MVLPFPVMTPLSFGYGPSGTPFVAFTTTVARRVQFQTPISIGDKITLEYQDSSTGAWLPVMGYDWHNGLGQLTSQNTASYGIGFDNNTTGTNYVTVRIGTYAFASGSTYGAAGTAWSGYTSVNWRVKKERAGAAVGFGIVQPGIASGLVSASGVPGNTTGNAIAAGYIGEEVISASRSSTLGTGYSSGSTYQNIASITLSAGVWAIYGAAYIGGVTAYLERVGLTISTSSSTANGISVAQFGWNTSNSNVSFMIPVCTRYVNISSSTPYYLNAACTTTTGNWGFDAGGNNGGEGALYAIRIA